MQKSQSQLQGAIDAHLYEHYQDWKSYQGFKNDSIALNYLLADFFGVEYPLTQVEINQRLEIFENQLEGLIKKVESLTKVLNQGVKIDPSVDNNMEVSISLDQDDLNVSMPKKRRQKKTSTENESINNEGENEKKSRKPRQKKLTENSYESMNKKALFMLLTERNIPHRIAPNERLKRKEEMIADLVASD